MKSWRWLLSCVVVSSLHASSTSADDATLTAWAKNRVSIEVLRPLAAVGGSRFSRKRPPPREHRVRFEQAKVLRDQLGRRFIRFAIDVRFEESSWHTDDLVGCIYTPLGDIYVKKGNGYRPAAFLEGKPMDAVPGVCTPGRALASRKP